VTPRFFRLVGLACAALCLGVTAASGQYFGQNKIRYRDFDFAILTTQHFDVYYYPAEKDAARQAALLAERWYTELAKRLRHQLRARQPLVLYASHADFAQTNVVEGWLGEATGGVTEGLRQRIAIPLGPGLAETNHVLAHELVHAFQYDIARDGHPSILAMPLWFIEGMAEYFSRPTDDRQTAMWMRDAVRRKAVPGVDELSDPQYFPYRYGHAFWTFLAKRFGDDVVRRLLTARAEKMQSRLAAITGVDSRSLSTAWRRWAEEAFAFQVDEPGAEPRPGPRTPPLVITRARAGRINVAPALSPDGRQIAFVSEKDLFSIEVFLADAATGRVTRKLVDRTTDPHFDSLEFVESSGTWSPDGRSFAFAATRGGEPLLVLLDVATGRTLREIPFHGLGQVWTPAWSPNGRQLAFAGSEGGQADLFVCDLASGDLRRLTHDAYADLQPAWSPDGRTLSFATDRFSTAFDALRPGPYGLATLDLASDRISPVPGAAAGQAVTPQFTADGRGVYYLSDRDGVPNVYRTDLSTGETKRVTWFDAGVAGITPVSPAISVNAKRLAFSVYGRGGYEIGVIDLATVLDVPPVPPLPEPEAGVGTGAADPGEFAPSQRASARELRDTAATAETDVPSFFREKRYKRSLSLDGIAQPYLSAGGGTTGAFFRAGMVMSFADMLGDQSLFLALQGGRRVDDFAGRAVYLNRRSRWNWGMSADFLPATFTQTQSQYVPSSNAVEHATQFERQTYTGLSGLAFYPFNRARRLELSGGLRQITFGNGITRKTVSAGTGETLSETTENLAAPGAIRLAETSVALVHDSAILGPASPLLGRRYRFEVAPSFGSLQFTTLLADFRQYVMPARPFTLAVRGRYIARTGHDAADPRLLPLVLNLRDQVRGYDLGELASTVCATAAAPDCSPLGVLTGSRLLTFNAELRFPLLGVFTRSLRYGPLPVEAFLFADAASLHTRLGGSSGGWSDHTLRSAGAGVRLSAAGVVFEFAAARPFDGADRGWRFAFNLVPGF
jgi:Tol biopolymer transport system component